MLSRAQSTAQNLRQERIDKAARCTSVLEVPKVGWLRYVRQALGMSGTQLARRMALSKASISQKEKAELDGSITIKALEAAAASMHCKLVYAIVPCVPSVASESAIALVISDQAEKKAREIVKKASVNMSLEDQALSESELAKRVKEIQKDMENNLPKELWED